MAAHCASLNSINEHKHGGARMEMALELWSDVGHLAPTAVMRRLLATPEGDGRLGATESRPTHEARSPSTNREASIVGSCGTAPELAWSLCAAARTALRRFASSSEAVHEVESVAVIVLDRVRGVQPVEHANHDGHQQLGGASRLRAHSWASEQPST